MFLPFTRMIGSPAVFPVSGSITFPALMALSCGAGLVCPQEDNANTSSATTQKYKVRIFMDAPFRDTAGAWCSADAKHFFRLCLRIILHGGAYFNFEQWNALAQKKSPDGDFRGLLGQEIWRALEHLPQNVLQNATMMVVGNFLRGIRTCDYREGLHPSVSRFSMHGDRFLGRE